jgi:hypothetical protein
VEELIAFLTASTEIEFEYPPEGAHTTEEVEHRTETGWRDPEWTPAPGAPTPPACWRATPEPVPGQATAAPGGDIEDPGTA